jgi:hypothetical protein
MVRWSTPTTTAFPVEGVVPVAAMCEPALEHLRDDGTVSRRWP